MTHRPVLLERSAADAHVFRILTQSLASIGIATSRSGRDQAATERPLHKGPEYHCLVQIATGTVIDGKIVLEGVPLAEGAVATVISRGSDERFTLTEAQEDELLAAMAEIERGEHVTLEDLLQSLPKHT